MQKSIIYGLTLSILLVIFASQNSDTSEIQFFFWEIQGPLAMLIFGSFVSGVALGLLLIYPSLKRKNAELKKTKKSLEQFDVQVPEVKEDKPEEKPKDEAESDQKDPSTD